MSSSLPEPGSLGIAKGAPNILLVTTDEERFALPRPDGFRLAARDRLAERGVSFERYYVGSAACSSSRSVIYTGQQVPLTRIYDNDNIPYVDKLDPELGTLGTMLRAAGYYCTYQGKWHLSEAYQDPKNPQSTVDALEPYGFSEFNDWGDIDGGAWGGLKVDPVIAGQAVGWLRNRAPVVSEHQPWFMAVNFVNPHDIMSFEYGGTAPIELPPDLAHAFVSKPPAEAPIYERRWDLDLPETLRDDLSAAAPAVHEFKRMADTMFGPVPGDDHWREGLNFYLNCIRDVDRSIELVLDALAASGQAHNTVVVFSSDHGEMVGSHGLRQKGNLVYDENFHVPLIISHPDIDGGTTTDALGSAVDLAPTLLAIAGVDSDVVETQFPSLHGQSLVPVLEGAAGDRDGVLTAVESAMMLDGSFWQAFGSDDGPERIQSGELRPDWEKRGFLRGFTDKRYTFGRYFSPLRPNRPADVDALFADNDVVLYDRQNDPKEQKNLAGDPSHRQLVAECSDRLEALINTEIGRDMDAWVTEKPQLLGWPVWHGDAAN
jgi:arylsulfatase A-like enzyme